MKNIFKIMLISMMLIVPLVKSYSQEWSMAQKDVWKLVEKEWELWKNGDVDGISAMVHEKYQAWNNEFPLPVSKSQMIEHFNSMKDSFKVNNYFINPARIAVTGNSAVVDYFYSLNITFGEGDNAKTLDESGRYVEFYTKEEGKWLLLGDMMVPDEEEEDE